MTVVVELAGQLVGYLAIVCTGVAVLKILTWVRR